MQVQNINEYNALRKENESIKKCITDYLGYLFLGIGAVISAWGGLVVVSDQYKVKLSVGYSAMAISLVITFMFLILVYKFISHNRNAGYCVLLSEEVWVKEPKINNKHSDDDIVAWELCINILRALDLNKQNTPPIELTDREEYLNEHVEIVDTPQERVTLWVCLGFFFRTLFRVHRATSWGFPVTITRIFFTFVFLCAFLGVFLLWSSANWTFSIDVNDTQQVVTFGYLVIIIIIQIVTWSKVVRRFHSVMVGEDSVLEYTNRFRDIRKHVLKERYDIKAKYILSGLIKDATKATDGDLQSKNRSK